MIHKFKLLILLLPSLFILALPLSAKAINLLAPACTNGQGGKSSVCPEANKQGGNLNDNPWAGKNGVIQKASNVIAIVGGTVAVVVIIIAGISYTTAGGAATGQRAGDNPTKAKDARAALIGAVIGLIAIALAWTVISFVTQKVIS